MVKVFVHVMSFGEDEKGCYVQSRKCCILLSPFHVRYEAVCVLEPLLKGAFVTDDWAGVDLVSMFHYFQQDQLGLYWNVGIIPKFTT